MQVMTESGIQFVYVSPAALAPELAIVAVSCVNESFEILRRRVLSE
jgi:hypothetical protein